MHSLDEKIGGLSARQQKALALLMQMQRRKKDEIPAIAHAEGSQFPLSFAQQRLWFIDKLGQFSESYHMPLALRMIGSVDFGALQQALSAIVQRHEALRTVFVDNGGGAAQRILPTAHLKLEFEDFSHCSPEQRAAQIRRYCDEDIARRFRLDADLMIRAALLKIAEQEHILLITLHHIAADGWSAGLLTDEIIHLYMALDRGETAALDPLSIRYADYAVWQRNWLQGETLEKELEYWRGKLSDAPAIHSLPLDRTRPAEQTSRGAVVSRVIDGSLLQRLKALCEQQQATLNMALQSAFAILLARWGRDGDVVFGTPIANRENLQTAPLVGFFVNTLVVRANLADNPVYADFLQRIKASTLADLEHQNLPFEMIVDDLKPERSLSHAPLFQIMFVFENARQRAVPLPGLQLETVTLSDRVAKFDLTLDISEGTGELLVEWEYNVDLFLEDTIARLADSFARLIASIVDDPSLPVQRLDILPPDQRRLTLHEWNQTAQPFPDQSCFHELFEQQVAHTPDAVALESGAQTLTYAQLNEQSNRLAHYLVSSGLRPDGLVGICLDRSMDMVVAILGVMKAGGAYVPLDPDYPAARLEYLIEDSGVGSILTQSHLLPRLPGAACPILTVDASSFRETLLSQPVSNISPRSLGLHNRHLCYVIYTSGSTGKPKGAMIEHAGLVNYGHWSIEGFRFKTLAGALVSSPISFDATVTSLLCPLICGGRAILLEAGREMELIESYMFEQAQPFLFKITPAHFNLLGAPVTGQRRSELPHVLVIGGEVLESESVRRWQEQVLPNGLYINEYGHTETVVACGPFFQEGPVTVERYSMPLGQPISNMRFYVVDAHNQPVPIGMTGELCAAGVGVCRGYHNRAELTAERFIDDPFSLQPDSKLYKSGDLVCRLPDGTFDFKGRLDDQIKIRGFRIEVGEIEHGLLSHPAIAEAAVIVTEESKDDRRLCAFVVIKDRTELTDDAISQWNARLKEHLASKLPAYMVPAFITAMNAFPLTPNGKIDKKAFTARGTLASAPTPQALNATQQQIRAIWEEVLKQPGIGLHDNFFAIGGHSLIAMRVVSAIRKRFRRELPLKVIFTHPTIHALASMIDGGLSADAPTSEIPALLPQATAGQDLCPLSFAQERFYNTYQLEGRNSAYHIPAHMRFTGALVTSTVERVINTILQRHHILRTRYLEVDGRLVQQVLPFTPMMLDVIDLSTLDEDERLAREQSLSQALSRGRFDFSMGVMLKAQLLRLAADEHVLLLSLHHICSDGWSVERLTDEFCTLFEAYAAGRLNPLPELTLQYKDYALWERGWLKDAAYDEQMRFWTTQLADSPQVHSVPLDFPRPALPSAAGSRVSAAIAPGIYAALRKHCQDRDATLFMAINAVFCAVLARWSGEEDIVVGTPAANRGMAELEQLIGCFINMLPLRLKADGALSFDGLLSESRRVCLDAYSHQHAPFDHIANEVSPVRNPAYSPIFQIVVSAQNYEHGELKLSAVTVSPYGEAEQEIKYDLSLEIHEAQNSLTLQLDYNTAIFRRETAQALLNSTGVLLAAVLAAPDAALKTLPIHHLRLPDLLRTAKADLQPQPVECLHLAFERQAARTPHEIALVCGGDTLTFETLNARANQLAHELRARGVQADELVAVSMRRSVNLLVSILGILKAGAAYVPLEPDYPDSRLRIVLENGAIRYLLTQQQDARARQNLPAQVWVIDTDESERILAAHPTRNLDCAELGVSAANLAYVIYTSGSTGKPKGVMVEHGSVIYLRRSIEQQLARVSGWKRWAWNAPVSFDASVQALAILGCDTTLYWLDEDLRLKPQALAEELARHRIDILDITPSHLQELMPYLATCGHLPNLYVGGEAIAPKLWQAIRDLYTDESQVALNVYGPTECTVNSTAARITEHELPTIGKPLEHCRAFVLDEQMRPVPDGVCGELYLSGFGVARGYCRLPEQTAETFVRFDQDGVSAVLYKTGDRVRRNAAGHLEYFGRFARQVKVRGYRIELSDIEQNLAESGLIAESAVLVNSDSLVAFLVAPEGAPDPSAAVQRYVEQHLPRYMCPARYIRLERMPRTRNGKQDHRALLALMPSEPQECYSEPENDVEATIQRVWQRVLNTERVSVTAGLYELGANSLRMMRATGLINSELGVQLSVRHCIEARTVRGVALQVTQVLDAERRQQQFAAAGHAAVIEI